MILLLQFLLRLTFGLAIGMGLTSPKQVTSGYYRNHLYVTLGLMVLATLVGHAGEMPTFWPTLLAAATSYAGSICWLYEKPRSGILCLFLVAGLAIYALGQSLPDYLSRSISTGTTTPFEKDLGEEDTDPPGQSQIEETYTAHASDRQSGRNLHSEGNWDEQIRGKRSGWPLRLQWLAAILSGLLLGFPMAAMLLGHWYLNTPTMELAPLRKLILMIVVVVVCQGIVSAIGFWGNLEWGYFATPQWVYFLLIRWLFGLLGVGILTWMAWQTLKIPNTQSATGILYVAVIGTFVGETMALLLSGGSAFPL